MAIEIYTRDTDTGVCEFRVPLAPADPPNNAVLEITNPNDGDGSIVITVTPDDGNAPYDITLPEPTVDTNTFATLADKTITFPNGDAIYVPAASTYNAATTSLTLDDGTVIDLSSFDTDTDTFATFNPATNIVTFADGSTMDLDDVDTDQYIDPASWAVNNVTGVVSYDLVDKDGNVVGDGSIDLSSFISTPHPSITGGGDVVVTGDSTVGWTITVNQDKYVAGANISISGTGTASDPYVINGAPPPAADGVVTGMTINAANVLTLTRSVGGPLMIDLSALADTADGVVTSGVLNGANQLVLNRTIGGPLTIDLTALAAGSNVADYINNIVLNGNILEVTGQNGAFSGNIDLSSLAGGGADGNITGATFNDTTNVLSITSDVGGPFNVNLSALAGGSGGGGSGSSGVPDAMVGNGADLVLNLTKSAGSGNAPAFPAGPAGQNGYWRFEVLDETVATWAIASPANAGTIISTNSTTSPSGHVHGVAKAGAVLNRNALGPGSSIAYITGHWIQTN